MDQRLIEQVVERGYMASASHDGTAQRCPQPRGAQEIIIPNVKGAVYDIEVSSLVEARPNILEVAARFRHPERQMDA